MVTEAFRQQVEARLASLDGLPVLPAIASALSQVIADECSSAEDIARVLEHDPSITAQVLRTANSAFYGTAHGAITSMPQAVARLGFREIERLSTTFAMMRTFAGFGPEMDHRQFWKHSVTAGITTRLVRIHSAHSRDISEDDAYISGLLHDIGALVLDQFFPEAVDAVSARLEAEGITRAEAELLELGLDHGEIGGMLLQRWNLPECVAQAVAWHHQPGRAPEQYAFLASTVHLADGICSSLYIGDGGDGWGAGFSDLVWQELGLTADDIPIIIDEVTAEARRSELLVGMG